LILIATLLSGTADTASIDLAGSRTAGKDAFVKSIKDYADYASKIWAAVLAAVLFLCAKKP
jgi:hypothetical protein